MTDKIHVALVGLGQAGEVFAEHFLEKSQEQGVPAEIIAVSDPQPDSPIALGFSQNGVPVFADPCEIAKLGEKVDIIFDLSGDSSVRQKLRLALLEHKNMHTVLASVVVARLLWYFFGEKGDLPTTARKS